MKYSAVISVLLAWAATALSSDAGETLSSQSVSLRNKRAGKDFRDGEIIIKYKASTQTLTKMRAAALSRVNAAKIQSLAHNEDIVHARLPAGKSVETALAELAGDPSVEYAQPNYLYHAMTTTPNDTSFGSLWGLKNTGQTVSALSAANSADSTNNPPSGSSTGKDMDLTHAWDYITDCSAVIVAVVDTGIKYDHSDLSANMWNSGNGAIPNHGWNVVTGASSANDPMDDHGHGTHVAGTIGAVGNNGQGTTGICWNVQLMAIKALDSSGSGSTSDIANGITWAANHGAKVINMSLGGSNMDAAMSSAIDAARTAGAVVIVAAGNDGTNNNTTPVYPCNFSKTNLLCVGALDQAYGLASFSNYGSSSVDVGAPGVNIASTWPYAVTPITDDFSSGWTYSPNGGGWSSTTLYASGVPYSTLVNPSNWNGSSAQYSANADHRVYKTFDLSGANKADLAYELHYDLENGADYVKIYNSGSGGDPVTSGTIIDQDTGTGAFYESELPISASCLTSTCSIGLRLTSNASTQGSGAVFLRMQINKSAYATTSYNVLEGTSMATPHVSGLAAMLFAYNPNYTYAEVIEAIKNGGAAVAALSGKTKTGKGVNAMGSLSYIQQPSGIGAVAQ